MNPFDRNSLPAPKAGAGAARGEAERPAPRSANGTDLAARGGTHAPYAVTSPASQTGSSGGAAFSGHQTGGGGAREGAGALVGRSLVRILCNAGSSALEYTHAFVSAYTADHFRGAVAQRLSVGAYELLSNALNFGSVSSDILLELIETDSVVGVRVSNEAISARISMLTEHLQKLRANAEQTFMEELRRSVTGGIPRPMLGLARVTHEAGLTLDLHVQDRRVTVTAQCRR